MGKLKDAIQDWLEDYGHALGFDMTNYPAIEDWSNIKRNNIDAEKYYNNKRAIRQEDQRIKHGFPEPPEVFDDE